MLVCHKCGQTLADGTRFCTTCGEYVAGTTQNEVQTQPTETIPTEVFNPNTASTVVQPTYDNLATQPPAPHVSAGTKVKGFIGMGLSITAIIGAVIALLYSLIALSSSDYDLNYALGGFSIFFALLFLAFAIPGLILSSSARNAGFKSGATKAGKVLGLISVIFCGVAIIFSLASF